ncbi:NAD(P)/FAD-dependent oxidoreductase [Celeribacter neptunius]|uniref:3-phenylpropionate/trans-cinnamate dioxygenase ferredoxin reductase subunit n=1 Tax=Celeribacter neptunius TaxID=588602 RepID=A0A1I3V6B6_9RHOB|nr:FAD-dependent oxidoreductase [Celeribacter neptunius]SFJ90692.1 3-phenylpropionate/trans-cinnamate dioxygenase ferredoxin reductase subunit [Celeribacter neptunius]
MAATELKRIVIIGAGQGGFQAAASLRQEGFAGEIVLIGDEPELPYQRPPLSKTYMKTGDATILPLRPESFYDAQGITLRMGSRVEAIDRAVQRVMVDDEPVAYDHLILATGTRNLRPPLPGIEHCLDLRSLSDAKALRAALSGASSVGVIGGGFIGLEFAAVARAAGLEVSVAEAAPRLMARAVSAQMSERFAEKHRALGTMLRLADPVAEISAKGLTLASGKSIACDFALLSAGVVPNTELAAEAGLSIENGIKVDTQLLTEDPAISALGDCASFPDPFSGRLVRLESVQAATDHARHIAKRLIKGAQAPYRAVPWFWSDQADWKLQIAGLAAPEDRAEELPDGTMLRLDGERVTAVETVNNAKVHMRSRKAMGQGTPLMLEDFAALAG